MLYAIKNNCKKMSTGGDKQTHQYNDRAKTRETSDVP